jgi:hypothetical protein
MDKHVSLFGPFVNYDRKKFHNICPRESAMTEKKVLTRLERYAKVKRSSLFGQILKYVHKNPQSYINGMMYANYANSVSGRNDAEICVNDAKKLLAFLLDFRMVQYRYNGFFTSL